MLKQWLKFQQIKIMLFVMAGMPLYLFAAEDATDIQIDVTHTPYVNLIGTAVGASRYYTENEVKPVGNRRRGPRVLIGTLGVEANVPGDCTLEFSTQNNFRLRHILSNQRLTNYRLRYNRTNITRRRNRTMTVPCNLTPRNIQWQAVGNFRNNVRPGIYRDIITVTVTTQ